MADDNKPSCNVVAGSSVVWDGDLTPEQCERFPVGKWLANGSFASAYEHRDDPTKIVKFTGDARDASAANRLKGRRVRGVVRVFDVARLKGQEADAPTQLPDGSYGYKKGQPVFGIITERVDPKLPKGYRNALFAVNDSISRYKDTLLAMEPGPDFKLPLEVDAMVAKECLRPPLKEAEADECLANSMDMLDAVEAAGKAGSIIVDLHWGNWGSRNGEPVILDFGVSKNMQPELELELAGLRHRGRGKKGTSMHRRRNRLAGWSRMNPSIDWKHYEEKAQRMSDNALHYALLDIEKTKPHSRELDREDGGDREGWYDDEASIYRTELKRRRKAAGLGAFSDDRKKKQLVIGVAVLAALALVFWPKKSKAETPKEKMQPTPAPTAGEGSTVPTPSTPGFVDAGTGTTIAGPSGQIGGGAMYTVQKGESWSNIASRAYGDYRWWPWLWDRNRAGNSFQNPDLLRVGDAVNLPLSPPTDAAYKAAIFARAAAHRKYWLDKSAGKSVTMPPVVYEQTPLP